MLSLLNIEGHWLGQRHVEHRERSHWPKYRGSDGATWWPLGELQGLDSVCMMQDTQPSREQAAATSGPRTPGRGDTDGTGSSRGTAVRLQQPWSHPPTPQRWYRPNFMLSPCEMGPAVSRPGFRARVFPPPPEEWPWGPHVLGSASRDVTGHSPVFKGSSPTGRWLCDRKKREEAQHLGVISITGSPPTPGM